MARSLQLALLAVLALALSPGACRAQAAGEAAALVAKMVEALGGEASVQSLRGWRYKGVLRDRDSTGEHLYQYEKKQHMGDEKPAMLKRHARVEAENR